MNIRPFHFLQLICFPALMIAYSPANSIPYGSPDSRSAAMGKTGIALAGGTNSAYFNPALLALYSERKHLGGHQRIAFPSVVGFASDDTLDLVDIDDAAYDQQLDNGAAEFNNSANPTTLIHSLEALSGDLRDTSSDPLFADVFADVIFSIPDRREGGAFYVGRRGVFDGRINYTNNDQELLSDYLEELRYVNDGGTPATLHPELYSGGQLINPSDTLDSSVDAIALLIDELAFSMAWAVTWWDTDMLIGITPKVVRVTAYEFTADAISSHLTQRGEMVNNVKLNIDLGWAKKIDDKFTVGLAIHNLVPERYHTESGRLIELHPQVRLGGAYQSEWGNYAIDLDLLESDPLSKGDPTQELGIGGEWSVGSHYLRAGIVSNLAASGENTSPLYTVGARFNIGHFYTDLSYGSGKNQTSAALQLGLRF
jgi:hypothetical protein